MPLQPGELYDLRSGTILQKCSSVAVALGCIADLDTEVELTDREQP
jgi:hypothetical protein